jgi:hypothetical protein
MGALQSSRCIHTGSAEGVGRSIWRSSLARPRERAVGKRGGFVRCGGSGGDRDAGHHLPRSNSRCLVNGMLLQTIQPTADLHLPRSSRQARNPRDGTTYRAADLRRLQRFPSAAAGDSNFSRVRCSFSTRRTKELTRRVICRTLQALSSRRGVWGREEWGSAVSSRKSASRL